MEFKNPWKLVLTAIVYQDQWINIHEDKVITPTGTDNLYGYMESNSSVIIVAFNEKDEIYLERKYGYAQHKWVWSLPGSGDKEDLLAAPKRELEEDTGLVKRMCVRA